MRLSSRRSRILPLLWREILKGQGSSEQRCRPLQSSRLSDVELLRIVASIVSVASIASGSHILSVTNQISASVLPKNQYSLSWVSKIGLTAYSETDFPGRCSSDVQDAGPKKHIKRPGDGLVLNPASPRQESMLLLPWAAGHDVYPRGTGGDVLPRSCAPASTRVPSLDHRPSA